MGMMKHLCFWITLTLTIFILYFYWVHQSSPAYKKPNRLTILPDKPAAQSGDSFIECGEALWRAIDYKRLPIPEAALRSAVSIPVESHMNFVNGENLHYKVTRTLTPNLSGVPVLLLHGASFTSSIWEELGTMSLVAAFGFPVVAIDLPGFGKSRRQAVFEKSVVLSDVIRTLQLNNPVIVSPSISGLYSFPYVTEHWKNVSGYVAISPVVPAESLMKDICYGSVSKKNFYIDETCEKLISCDFFGQNIDLSCVTIPVMVVHGEYDKCKNSALMCHFPWSKAIEIPKGQHAAYMSNPSLWHKLLYNFLYAVNKTRSCQQKM